MNHHASRLLIDEPALQVLPSLAVAIGLNEAIVLQQMHYWLRTVKEAQADGNVWVYNTYAEWQTQFPFWSVDTIRGIIRKLETPEFIASLLGLEELPDHGLVISTEAFNADRMTRRKWYRISYEFLDKLANPPDQLASVHSSKLASVHSSSSIHENTSTETLRTPSKTGKSTRLKPVERPYPEDFAPTPEMIQRAMQRYGISEDWVKRKTESFADWALSKGKRFVDWDRAWMNFMAPRAWDGPMTNGSPPVGSRPDEQPRYPLPPGRTWDYVQELRTMVAINFPLTETQQELLDDIDAWNAGGWRNSVGGS